MKIKEVEDLVGITKANIRYYEKEGLLNPKRNEENNYREYTLEDVRSLELTPNQFNRNIAVMFTADMRIHLALFHASALILTPFVISLYGFVQMLLNSSEMPVQTMGRMQMLVFWAMLLVYVGCFFCLAQKWGAYLKDIHIAALSAAYTAVMTALFGLVWGKWLFAAAAFFAFTLYIGTVWKDGIFHADGVHAKVVLPVCVIYFLLLNGRYLYQRQWKKIFHDPFNFVMAFLLFNSVVYGLYDCGSLRRLVEALVPPLEGWQFNRTIFFNPFLWYGALFLVLIRLYDRGIWTMWLANGIVCAAALAVILTPNRYNDLYFTCYNRAYEHFHGTEVDELDYEQFYAQALFEEIKEAIDYQGEWSAAYGLHPAVLEYNGIATLDGYLGFYSQQYKEDFRRIIAPALERVEQTRIYYDDWGARAYLYSGTDLSIVQATKTVYATDNDIYIDVDAFRELGGTYIFSRLELTNAAEAGLVPVDSFTARDGSCTVYVYRAAAK